MKTTIMMLAATAACLAPSLLWATQAPENPVFIYATYFHCNSGTVERADEAVAKQYKSELNRIVKEGAVSSWGWLRKDVGGEWARAGFLTGASLEAVLNAAYKHGVMSEGHPPKREFEEACSSGEDYIWHVLAGSNPPARLGKVAFSTYFVCDQARETQADALVKRVVGPVYDKMVADGKLTTWTWAEHIIGGKYRRLATMTAQSMDVLIAAREALVAAAEHDPLDEALTSICGSHQDVIWEVQDQSGP
jgi:hypothetical protein